ncbi:MAG: UDP-N-acetylglucosamine--N-acetylmuramyl-(pentapeptide) pyrophosphoryl-undecaprenol N-acetylglucosamine transferase [Acidimicrobiia bacterium]|nr:UDP-N-acetylglucosamine--N-acetylmuramyl-(pentapeptide) pyrophosphoryl-undecaprenol N-acetylglucosamine transferase [Acidimicrobiia bacterium]MBT8215182.1 UDP-N-acetylglucosamine--N-acetylmuramyl-(pentapeptide) pyrophosphoryl-undecaprenol N-acetylglucosamine transferase [Acidimicrobiia bacterium]NNF69496.1 UDP-N-acetylglucosamine--N-acetylmuramyl-(pentapeptide) pyrophosphoryl-undecaprenol N-acetylglucosamine transferase [Acidimicrobiia bacterium]NNK91412.1 UDP-N-acetylglucosamine--N-acetylmur
MIFGLAAAGTGGHVFPALAVAGALVDRGIDRNDIVFFGGDRIEARVVPEAGYELVQLPLRGLERRITTRNLAIPGMVRSAAAAVRHRLEADGAVSLLAFGGYVTVPAVWGARRAGVPAMLHEQNAVPGLANRLMSRFAQTVYVAFDAALDTLDGATVIGNPLRPEFDRYDRNTLRPDARKRYGLEDGSFVVGILGGSQGAAVLNRAADSLVGGSKATLLHLTGRANIEDVQARAAASDRWVVVAFEPAMENFYAACDLIVSRAGALTMSEVAATSTPAVVVPFAAGTGGHQAANAAALASAGGVVVIPEDRIGELTGVVTGLVEDPDRLESMRTALQPLARHDAAGVLADAMIEAGRLQ